MCLTVALSKRFEGNQTKIGRDRLLSLLRGRGMMAPSVFDQPPKMRNLWHFWCSIPHIMGIHWKLWIRSIQIWILFPNVVTIGEAMEEVTFWLLIIPTLAAWWYMSPPAPSTWDTDQVNADFWSNKLTVSAGKRWDLREQYSLRYWMVYLGSD